MFEDSKYKFKDQKLNIKTRSCELKEPSSKIRNRKIEGLSLKSQIRRFNIEEIRI